MKEIFQTLRKPLKKNNVRKFVEGQFNQGMIEELYKNYKLVNLYYPLIGNKNKELMEKTLVGVKASF